MLRRGDFIINEMLSGIQESDAKLYIILLMWGEMRCLIGNKKAEYAVKYRFGIMAYLVGTKVYKLR